MNVIGYGVMQDGDLAIRTGFQEYIVQYAEHGAEGYCTDSGL